MKKSALIASAAVLGLLSTSASAGHPSSKGTEKCYGIAKAGENACASADGSHACAGAAKTDNDPNEWKSVKAGSCEAMGGSTNPPSEASDDNATDVEE